MRFARVHARERILIPEPHRSAGVVIITTYQQSDTEVDNSSKVTGQSVSGEVRNLYVITIDPSNQQLR